MLAEPNRTAALLANSCAPSPVARHCTLVVPNAGWLDSADEAHRRALRLPDFLAPGTVRCVVPAAARADAAFCARPGSCTALPSITSCPCVTAHGSAVLNVIDSARRARTVDRGALQHAVQYPTARRSVSGSHIGPRSSRPANFNTWANNIWCSVRQMQLTVGDQPRDECPASATRVFN